MRYQYQAFGLNIQSDIKFPELLPAEGDPDVTIHLGRVPDSLEKPKKEGVRFQTSPGKFLLTVDDIAKYFVSDGNTITIEPLPKSDIRDVRLFTLGSVFGALIHQRGMLPIHASAIRVNDYCVAFCGMSGNGKSTLANEFLNRGFQLHADDLCVVSSAGTGKPVVFPAYPQLKLWKDAMKNTGIDPTSFNRVREVLDKYSVPVTETFNLQPLPLLKMYILAPYNQKEIKHAPVTGIDKFKALKNHTFRFKFVEGLGQKVAHFKSVEALAKHVPLTRVHRPNKPYRLKELADMIEMDFSEEYKSAVRND